MPKPDLASIQLQHLRKGYIYGGPHVAQIAAKGEGKWVAQALASTDLSSQSLASAADIIDKRHRRSALAYIERLLSNDRAHNYHVDFQFVESHTPNGFAAWHPGDNSYAIGIDPALWSSFSVLTLAAILAYDTREPDILLGMAQRFARSLFHKSPVRAEDFEELISLMYERAPVLAKQLSELSGPFYVQLLIAHEVGHIVLGHLLETAARRFSFGDGEKPIPISGMKWEDEFAADTWALDNLLNLAGVDIVQRTLAVLPVLFFDLLAIVESLHMPETEIARVLRESHPPPRERANHCHAWAARHVEVPPTPAMALLVNVAQFTRKILDNAVTARRGSA